MDERKAGEIVRLGDAALGGEEGGRADREERLAEEELGGDVRPLPGAIADADIDPVAGEVDQSRRGVEPHLDYRMRRLEGGQARDEPDHREGRGAADRQHVVQLRPGAADQRRRLAELREGVAHEREIDAADGGELEAAMAALEEAAAQALLEMADLMADRRRRQVELGGRPGEAQMPRRRLEGAQRMQRREGGHASRAYPAQSRG